MAQLGSWAKPQTAWLNQPRWRWAWRLAGGAVQRLPVVLLAVLLLPAVQSVCVAGEGQGASQATILPAQVAAPRGWNAALDLYCERTSPAFWAEPLNAWSNLAFVLAGILGWRLAERRGCRAGEMRTLAALAVIVGVGSFLFHTFATYWAMWFDLIPIFLYQLWFLWLYSRRVIGLRGDASLAIVAGFFLVMMLAMQIPANFLHLNGSATYAPALAMIIALGVYHASSKRREPWLLLAAGGVFLIALSFRTLDNVLCPVFPRGTHFLWHTFNGGLLYLTLRALIVNWPERP
jgi:hypothetical protein